MDGFLVPPLNQAAQIILKEFVLDLHGGKRNVPLKCFVKQQSHVPSVLGNKGKG